MNSKYAVKKVRERMRILKTLKRRRRERERERKKWGFMQEDRLYERVRNRILEVWHRF